MEKVVFRKTLNNFDLEDFRSESFSICTSCIESSRFRARVAKGRATFRPRDRAQSGVWQMLICQLNIISDNYSSSDSTLEFCLLQLSITKP